MPKKTMSILLHETKALFLLFCPWPITFS